VGFRFRPNSIVRSFYPDSPRGYFSTNASTQDNWALELDDGTDGQLEHSDTEPGRMRVKLSKTNPNREWPIRLVEAPFELQPRTRYAVRFRARADASRTIACVVEQNHPPWELISPYRLLEIQPDWQSFECPFTAKASDSNARISFWLGSSEVPIELEDVVLRDLSAGRDLTPAPQFFVRYRFNSLGFRGPDYAIPAPQGTFRIVILGDSFTLGQGVHEEDTFAAQLESRLNAAAMTRGQHIRFEVINTGVTGYSTEQERISYERFSSAYMPHIVLVSMVYNDDMGFLDEVRLGMLPAPIDPSLSALWARISELRQPGRDYDYSSCVRELLLLHESCRRRGSRLAVVIFRQSIWDPWLRLVEQVTRGLRGTDIPVLDLGPMLLKRHRPEDLMVHPIDGHPNETAHRLAAEEIETFLRAQGLVP
jgi:hypothetical protein